MSSAMSSNSTFTADDDYDDDCAIESSQCVVNWTQTSEAGADVRDVGVDAATWLPLSVARRSRQPSGTHRGE